MQKTELELTNRRNGGISMVARSHVGKVFLGLSSKSLANLNSLGRGPKPYRAKCGRKIFYKVEDVETFLRGEEAGE